VLGKLDSYMQKKEMGHLLTPYIKINSKWIKGPTVRPETIRILEENLGRNFFDISHRNIFIDMSPQARETKAKINYWDYTQMKSFCTVKETINQTKRQPTE